MRPGWLSGWGGAAWIVVELDGTGLEWTRIGSLYKEFEEEMGLKVMEEPFCLMTDRVNDLGCFM